MMATTPPAYLLLDTFVDAMTSGRVPTQSVFVCPNCCGPARASASPVGDVLSISIRCPCPAMELERVPKWLGWEALLLPPPSDFNANPLALGPGRSRTRVRIALDLQRMGEGVPCPHCGAPLATAKAKQCFVCRMDWHDPVNVIQRPDPMRERLSLEWRTMYVVELCQGLEGARYIRYRPAEGGKPNPHQIFETPAYPGWQWVAWGEHGFAGDVATTTDEEFVFSVHGVWLTWDEVRGLHRHRRGEAAWADIPWATGVPPAFPADGSLQGPR